MTDRPSKRKPRRKTLCECGHPMRSHDDADGCRDCHKLKDECFRWIQFRDYIEERDH